MEVIPEIESTEVKGKMDGGTISSWELHSYSPLSRWMEPGDLFITNIYAFINHVWKYLDGNVYISSPVFAHGVQCHGEIQDMMNPSLARKWDSGYDDPP